MGSGSSAKKVAKLAQRSKGRAVRFRGGSLFPVAVLVVVMLGLALIVYSRVSLPKADASPPTIEDHWHEAFGIYVCGQWLPKVVGTAESPGEGGSVEQYERNYVHSHNDGLIHWHPFSGRAVGRRAKLKVFFDTYGIKLSDDELQIDDSQPGYTAPDGSELRSIKEGETTCDGQDGELSVAVWPSYASTDNAVSYVTRMDEAHIDSDGMVFVIAFVPNGTTIPQPEWAARLPELGAADAGQTAPSTTTAGQTTLPPPAGGASTTVAPATTAIAGTTTTNSGDQTTITTPAAATTTSG